MIWKGVSTFGEAPPTDFKLEGRAVDLGPPGVAGRDLLSFFLAWKDIKYAEIGCAQLRKYLWRGLLCVC